MRTTLFRILALSVMVLSLTARPVLAEQPKGNPKEEAALLKNAEAFVEAFHKGDAKAVAAFWAPDGDYTDQTGKEFKGRMAIQKVFEEFFSEHKGLKLRIDSESLRFITPDVAVEDGMTSVITPDGAPPSRVRYTIVHAKKNGEWLMCSVRDAPYAPPTNHEHLRQLDWAIGTWAGETGSGEVARYAFSWGENQNYIDSSFTTTFKNIAIGGGTQRIGWDASAKNLRTWTFYTDGGFGEGVGTRDGNKWVIKTKFVLRDGKKVEATNVITRIDADTLSWQTKNRSVDGTALPDTKEVKMKREQ